MTVDIPPLGLGCANLGNLYRPMTDEDAGAIVGAALDAGYTYFDTAPHYGVGLSEERLGRALAGRDRASYTLSTKVGRRLRDLAPGETEPACDFFDVPARARAWDLTRDGIRATLESSLERLGTDRVDIAFIHDPENHVQEVYDTGFAALAELKAEKMVGAIGFGMNFSDHLARFVTDLDVDVVMCASRWTMLERTAFDDLLPAAERRGTSVVVAGVYNTGLLADPRPGARYDYTAAPVELVSRAQRMAEVCARFDVPLKAAALRYPFAHPAVASVVVGASSPGSVRENAALARQDIPDGLWTALVEEGLLDRDLPLPSGP
ncbi:aldo/keto reductase [Streptomyces sp. NPDC051940]|uniref:aldo/keto reductase n=1 Tax=Streptomyces sp. NPDC051940 TaxID=3155675 RepID=UPI0034225B86